MEIRPIRQLTRMFFSNRKYMTVCCAIIVLVISFFTYFNNYHKPAGLFWDENYHIPSAEKYIQGVMFMECHPPLGKLLIALGEVILSPNRDIDKTSFTSTDYISGVPPGMSFSGYRFFPTLFATCGAVLFFLLLFFISRNNLLSLAGSSLYLFDNALVVHFRGAMLDGIQLFFIFAALLCFLCSIRDNRKPGWIHYSLLGLLSGLAISVKLNSTIILPLFVIMFGYEYKSELINSYNEIFSNRNIKNGLKQLLFLLKKSLPRVAQSVPVILIVFILVFWVHTGLGSKIPADKTYAASPEYIEIMQQKRTLSISSFPVMLGDNLSYIANYHKGVPKLDLTNPGENGSHPFNWPFGNKTINYKWEKTGNKVRYLYLVGNPVIWTIGLAGILLGFVLAAGRFIFKTPVSNKNLFNLVMVFLFLYVSYMYTMISIDRVMYLYHYLIPLQFSLFTAFLVFTYIYEEYIKKNSARLFIPVLLIAILIFKTFLFFSPLTYYKELTAEQFQACVWSANWRLENVK